VAADFKVRVSSQYFGQLGSFFREQCFMKENTEPFWNMQECCIFNMESSKLINYQFGRHVLKLPLYYGTVQLLHCILAP
jgi:hypothetical protein